MVFTLVPDPGAGAVDPPEFDQGIYDDAVVLEEDLPQEACYQVSATADDPFVYQVRGEISKVYAQLFVKGGISHNVKFHPEGAILPHLSGWRLHSQGWNLP